MSPNYKYITAGFYINLLRINQPNYKSKLISGGED